MSLLYESRAFTGESKQQAVQDLRDRLRPDRDYYVLLVGAIVLAIGAIFTDSLPSLIASMIVAPLAAPIVGLGLGIAAGNRRLIGRALALLAFSCGIALFIAMFAAMLFGNDRQPDILISFNGNTHIAVLVAVVSGVIAAYGSLRPKVAAAAAGVSIAVSLMPPLVATGIGLAPGGVTFQGAPLLFLLNVLGISLSSALVFWLLGVGQTYRQQETK